MLPAAEAAALMSARAVGSIVVVGDRAEPLGIVTDRDLRNRVVARGASTEQPVARIMSAPLVSVLADTPAFEALLEMTRQSIHHLGVVDVGRLVAEINDRLVARALVLLERALEAEGHGRPPVAYSWLVAGSEGRREQTLKTDQDNALIYADSPKDGAGMSRLERQLVISVLELFAVPAAVGTALLVGAYRAGAFDRSPSAMLTVIVVGLIVALV